MKNSFTRFLCLFLTVALLLQVAVVTASPVLVNDSNQTQEMQDMVAGESHDCCEETTCLCNDGCEQACQCSVSSVFLALQSIDLNEILPVAHIAAATIPVYLFSKIDLPERPPRL